MNLVRNVTVAKETCHDWQRLRTEETVRVDLDLNPRAHYAIKTFSADDMVRMGSAKEQEAYKRYMTEKQGRHVAHEVAHQVRKEIEESVLRLLGFLKPGERGSLSKA